MSQQKEIGTLVVVILKAQHLHQPSFYKQDPYAQACLSGLKKRTKTAPKGGQHPVWDDELRFPVLVDMGKDKINRILEIACYKDEQRGEDVLLGKGSVDIEETLKAGEFDDWVPLETSAGARGEIYLEMTFYANSPPPMIRRPSKLSPFDLLARPAQGGQSSSKTPVVTSPQSGRSPVAAERRPLPSATGSGNQIPASLIPAHGATSKSQASGLVSPAKDTSSITAKRRDNSLPPLPANNNATDDQGFPAALHPGGRSGSRPMLPQNRNRMTSMGLSSPEILPEQLNRRTLSDTPGLQAMSRPVQSYFPERTSMERVGLAPSIIVDPLPAFPIPLSASPSGTTQAQGYSRTLSSFQPPIASRTPPGHEHYDMPPSNYQQYTQYPSGPITSQILSPQSNTQPQSTQLQQQQSPSSRPQPSYQQHYLPSQQQQQYHLPYLSYTHPPHPSQVTQPYQQHNNNTVLPSSNQPNVAPQPLSCSQTQPYFQTPPPPPPFRSQTPQMHTQTYLSPPAPLPPPPSLYNQSGKGPTATHPAEQQLQTTISPIVSSQQNITPATASLQSPTTVSDIAPPTSTGFFGQRQTEERRNEVDSVTTAEMGTKVRKGLEDGHQTSDVQDKKAVMEGHRQQDQLKYVEEQGMCDERDPGQPIEDETRHEQGLQRYEEQEREGKLREQEELGGEEEFRKTEEEKRRKQEEEEYRREDEERREKEEIRRREEKERERQEELRRREEEERRRQEEERIQREREEVHKRRAEEAEAEKRWQEELACIRARAEQEAADAVFARAQMEAEQAEQQRQEEADLALVRQAQEEAEQEERFARERRQQVEADMEVARREQAHEEELERRRQEERKKRMEEADRELARRLDMELNLNTESLSNEGD